MSEASKKAEQALERFRSFRTQQRDRLSAMQKLADIIEVELQTIANHAGSDPVNDQPIFRLSKQMPDFAIAWGLYITPLGGLSASITLDRNGNFALNLGGFQTAIELTGDGRGSVVAPVLPNMELRRITDIILEFLADQLNNVVETNAVISS